VARRQPHRTAHTGAAAGPAEPGTAAVVALEPSGTYGDALRQPCTKAQALAQQKRGGGFGYFGPVNTLTEVKDMAANPAPGKDTSMPFGSNGR
jgi:hypothetical protein